MARDVEGLRVAWPIERVLTVWGLPQGRNGCTQCPFCYHLQQTPADTFSYQGSLWHCHRCLEGGDSIRLVERLEGVGFREACDRLDKDKSFMFAGSVRSSSSSPPRSSGKVFTFEDERSERASFLVLERMIGRVERSGIARVRALVKCKELTEEEGFGEEIAIRGIIDGMYEELDQVRSELIYWLRCLIRGSV